MGNRVTRSITASLILTVLALLILQCSNSADKESAKSIRKIDSLISVGNLSEAQAFAEREQTTAKSGAHLDQWAAIASALSLGKIYALQKRFAQAETTFLEVLAQVDDGSSKNKAFLAISLAGLGVSYCGQLKYRQAIEPLERALQLERTVALTGYFDRSSLLCYLGAAYAGSGKASTAIPYLEESVRIQSADLGGITSQMAQQLYFLANAYNDLNRLDTAEALYRRVVDLTNTSPPTSKSAYYLCFLARFLQEHDKIAEALYYFDRALQVTRLVSPDDPRELAISIYDVGNCLREMERFAPAESLLTVAITLLQNNVGASNHNTARAVFYLALLRRDQGRTKEADSLFRQSLQTTETAYGGNSIELAEDLEVFARFLVYRNRLLEAEQSFRRAIAITESASGPNYWKLVKYYDDLAGVLERLGKKPEMLEAKKRAESIRSYRG